MASAEEDFPRGGTAKKSTDGKPVVHRGEVDNLFQVDNCSSSPLSVSRCAPTGPEMSKIIVVDHWTLWKGSTVLAIAYVIIYRIYS